MSAFTRRRLLAAGMGPAVAPRSGAKPLEPLSPGIKISMQVNDNVTDDDLTWIKQMGVEYLNVQTGKGRAHARELSGDQEAGGSGRVEGLEYLEQR